MFTPKNIQGALEELYHQTLPFLESRASWRFLYAGQRVLIHVRLAAFIKLEYVVGNSLEMKKYVPPQAAPSRRNVIIKILTDNRCLMYFVNSVSHPSDCFYIVSI